MTTKPPKQREGQEFPGGKTLRKRMKRLKARQEAMPSQSPKGMKMHKPGSMK